MFRRPRSRPITEPIHCVSLVGVVISSTEVSWTPEYKPVLSYIPQPIFIGIGQEKLDLWTGSFYNAQCVRGSKVATVYVMDGIAKNLQFVTAILHLNFP